MTIEDFQRPLNTEEAAELLGLSPNTLRCWRVTGDGPRSYRIGRKSVKYDVADLAAWLTEQKERSGTPAGH